MAIHGCVDDGINNDQGETARQLADSCPAMMSKGHAFLQFKYSVFIVFLLIGLVALNITLITVQLKNIDRDNPIFPKNTVYFCNKSLLQDVLKDAD